MKTNTNKSGMVWSVVFAALFFGVIIYFFISLLPGSRAIKPTEMTGGMIQARTIGLALRSFKERNGNYPEKLSELIPGFIGTDKLSLFYSRSGSCKMPSNLVADIGQIDKACSFLYFGTLPLNERVILTSRPECFSDGIIVYDDYSVVIIPNGKLYELLNCKGKK